MIPNYGLYPQQMQRLNYLESQMPNQPIIKGRPVSSIEEVKGALVDFDGSISYFPDMANNRIFTKQIGLNGQSAIQMYQLTELPVAQPQQDVTKNFVTQTEFNDAIKTLTAQLNNIKQGGSNDNVSDTTKSEPTQYAF